MGVMHVKTSNIDVFFVTSFLCSPKFLLFHLIGHTTVQRGVYKQIYRQTDRPGQNNTSQPPPGAR